MKRSEWYSTYSIIAMDQRTGEIGGAVQTHQMGVGAIIPSIEPGVGAVCSQSMVNFTFPETALTMLRQEILPTDIIAALTVSDAGEYRRQVAVMNAAGNGAVHSGSGCIPEFGHEAGDGWCIQANMMTRPTVVDAMKQAFLSSSGDLGERLLAALQAAQAEDGDIRGMQSAALLVLPNDKGAPRWKASYDLRVDESDDPVAELTRLVRLKRAWNISEKGETFWEAGEHRKAADLWREACGVAPELEELAFWPAVSLASERPWEGALTEAADFLRRGVVADPRWPRWKDLLHRLESCGLIDRKGTAAELLAELERGR